MSTTWILIANASRAQLYSAHKARLFLDNNHDDVLRLISSFDHIDSRKKASSLVSDKSGSYRAGGAGHGSFSESTNPKEYEAETFAKELVNEMETGRIGGKFDDLVLIALPHFQGLLKKNTGRELGKLVSTKIKKDFTNFSGRQLIEQLDGLL